MASTDNRVRADDSEGEQKMKYARLNRAATFAVGLALAAFALLGLARPAAAGEQVPFKGHLEGGVTMTPLAPPIVSVLINGAGNATHLGALTVVVPHLV